VTIKGLREAVQKTLDDPVIQNRSVLEANMIIEGMSRTKAGVYVDCGCWAGLLARDVVKRSSSDKSGPVKFALLIDGVEYFVQRAEELIQKAATGVVTNFLTALLVPDTTYGSSMRLHISDTSAASVFENRKDSELIIPKQVLTAGKLKETVLPWDQKSAYVKLDLDGLDISFLKALFRAGYRPAVVHFEVKDAEEYDSFMPVLVLNGYYPPSLPKGIMEPEEETSPSDPEVDKQSVRKLKKHEFWSVACGPDFAYVLGINPDEVYGPMLREEPLSWLKLNEPPLPVQKVGQ